MISQGATICKGTTRHRRHAAATANKARVDSCALEGLFLARKKLGKSSKKKEGTNFLFSFQKKVARPLFPPLFFPLWVLVFRLRACDFVSVLGVPILGATHYDSVPFFGSVFLMLKRTTNRQRGMRPFKKKKKKRKRGRQKAIVRRRRSRAWSLCLPLFS
nr:hypothetical protein [Pandoravirus aubagnensis]